MKYTFAARFNNITPSGIRAVLEKAAGPDMINFSPGFPDNDAFPANDIQKISQDVLKEDIYTILQYSRGTTYPPLKKALKAFFNRQEKIFTENDDLMVTSGSGEGLEMAAKVFLNPGESIIVEDPTFVGALNGFISNDAKLLGVPVESDGMNLGLLEEAMQSTPAPKLLYIIPTFQNPTCITTSLEKRRAIYDLCLKYNIIILEDNPYGDLRFRNDAIPSIKSLDDEGLVVYAASFSKIIAPGMRVAVMIGHQDLLAKCTVAKQTNDVHTNAWAQSVMARFLNETDMEVHLKKLQAVYEQKCNLMLEEMKKQFSPDCKWTIPDGGMFIWVTLPERIDMPEFVKRAVEHKVAVVPGNAFYDDDNKPCQSFRMNFSTPTNEQIIKGVAILGALMHD